MMTRCMSTKKMVLMAVFLGIGMVLPFVTMQVPVFGNALLPMHIPVLLCGFICGWPYGLLLGFILPIFRSLIFGMPAIMPTAFAMSFELAAYGAVTGFLHAKSKKTWGNMYCTLAGAMISGRVVWGIVSVCLYASMGSVFTWKIFVVQGFLNAVPGIVIQFLLIPALVKRLSVTVDAVRVSYE